jgi:hypothetical protein
VRQRCVALLLRDCGGGGESGGGGGGGESGSGGWKAAVSTAAWNCVPVERRAGMLLWLTDLVLQNIDTEKLEGAVHRFH